MPRERTTWNRDEIAKKANHTKNADPYLMNQDHVKAQPSADKYVIGDPSTFAEDPHPSAGTWEAEYSGDQVKRNEIGMPEMRSDTFNHPEKTASSEATLLAKAALAVSVARAMLPKTASEGSVEAQAETLMHLSDIHLAATYKRLAAEDQEEEEEDQGQKQAQDDKKDDKKDDKGEKWDGKGLPPWLEKKAQQDQGQQDQGQQEQKQAQQQDQGQQDQGQQKQGQQQQQIAQLQQMQQQVAAMLQQAQQGLQGQQQAPQMIQAQDQAQQDQAQQEQKQAQDQAQQDQAQQQEKSAKAIYFAMKQAMADGKDPVQAAALAAQACMAPAMQQQAQAPMQQAQVQQQGQVQQQADAQLIDQMLSQQDDSCVSDAGIEMEAPTMDMGEFSMTADDAVLKQLFATQESEDAQQAQSQQKQAHVVRTASTRTVGTRPTQGVSQLGGLPSAGNRDEVSNLSSMWSTAPDVRSTFGS